MLVGKITRLELEVVLVVTKCFIQLQARFSSRQEQGPRCNFEIGGRGGGGHH